MMAGDLVAFDVAAAIKKQAAVERDRIISILAAIDELKAATLSAEDQTLSEAEVYLAMSHLTDAEDKLLDLVLDPGFARYQRELRNCLSGFVSGAA